MAINFRDVIDNLVDIGLYDVFLPFILVYAVVFAILEKSRIFEKEDNDKNARSVNSVIAFVFGLFVVASIQTVIYIQSLIVNIVVFLIFILVVMIALGFIFGKDFFKHIFEDGKNKVLIWIVAGIILLVSVGVLFSVLGVWDWFFDWFDFDVDNSDITSWIVVLLIGAVIYWVTKSDSNSQKSE